VIAPLGLALIQPLLARQDMPPVVRLDPGFELAGHRLVDADGDGRAELIVVGREGNVKTLRPLPREGEASIAGELVLPEPRRTLLDLATFAGSGYLVAQTPSGTLAYRIESAGRVAARGATWIPRARFGLRLEAPTFTGIVRDVNRDGVDDVVVPSLAGVELWLGSLPADGGDPTFRKAATVTVEVVRWGAHDAEYLSDSLEGSFAIPDVDTRDVNGDGRPDLVVSSEQRRAFHLQRADGAFPLEADVEVDLAIFRDTTEAASIQLGGTLTVGDKASYSSRDLDGDEIPDYVIGHRRKVWVFRGTKAGPQFTQPSAILKTAEDVTALLVHPLDEDARADLLLVKVQIPTLATLLRGLFGEWDVRVRALGYRNLGEGKFETSPSLSNELSIRLPGIVGLVKNPERILERFEDVGKRFRTHARGDLDGNAAEDVLLVTEDRKALEVWFQSASEVDDERTGQRRIREILFDDRQSVWDMERVFAAFGSFAQQRVARLTGGRRADRLVPLRDPEGTRIVELDCADFDGDGADEVVVAYADLGEARSGWFEVLRLRAGEPEKK
jgi:hypothetical protein